ncbi:MAG: pilus assembly protein [Hyphomicrobium sp.]|nr:pilus assembly protein [Hyphomicrobium sp.]
MRFLLTPRSKRAPRLGSVPRRLLHDDGGAAAIEFALVALPFLLFILGLLGMGLYYLAGTSARVRGRSGGPQDPHRRGRKGCHDGRTVPQSRLSERRSGHRLRQHERHRAA